jgi:hypothetical protein
VIDILASLDTGASNCLFERKHGELLNLDIEAGDRRTFELRPEVLRLTVMWLNSKCSISPFESRVYFFADERINKNLLGRAGWLDRIRLGLIDHDGELYLSAYD